jgi:hypothetical protein
MAARYWAASYRATPAADASAFDQHARALFARLFPDQKLSSVTAEHPLFQSFYKITDVRDQRSSSARPAEQDGITIKDRLGLVYSKNDMISHLKQVSDPYGNGYDAEFCRRLCANFVAYALQN